MAEGLSAFDSINASINIFPIFPVPIKPAFNVSSPPLTYFLLHFMKKVEKI
jgi:hypothetical protein